MSYKTVCGDLISATDFLTSYGKDTDRLIINPETGHLEIKTGKTFLNKAV